MDWLELRTETLPPSSSSGVFRRFADEPRRSIAATITSMVAFFREVVLREYWLAPEVDLFDFSDIGSSISLRTSYGLG